MEKIKQALERASSSRSSIQSKSRHNRITKQVSESGVPQSITYIKTKTIEVSKDHLKDKRVIADTVDDAISDQYKVLRTRVLQRLTSNNWNSIAITSPNEGCGKTLTTINLAISLAKDLNHSVLLVDMDLRRPSIQQYFSNAGLPGISEYLTEGIELNQILFNPGIERLVIMPGNKPLANSSEMLSSPRMVHLIDDIKSRYSNRIVIFDMPPVLTCDDMIAFSPYIDTALVVVGEGETLCNELKRTYELLEHINIIGTVLNKSSDKIASNTYYKE